MSVQIEKVKTLIEEYYISGTGTNEKLKDKKILDNLDVFANQYALSSKYSFLFIAKLLLIGCEPEKIKMVLNIENPNDFLFFQTEFLLIHLVEEFNAKKEQLEFVSKYSKKIKNANIASILISDIKKNMPLENIEFYLNKELDINQIDSIRNALYSEVSLDVIKVFFNSKIPGYMFDQMIKQLSISKVKSIENEDIVRLFVDKMFENLNVIKFKKEILNMIDFIGYHGEIKALIAYANYVYKHVDGLDSFQMMAAYESRRMDDNYILNYIKNGCISSFRFILFLKENKNIGNENMYKKLIDDTDFAKKISEKIKQIKETN
jgi:hypothetical protein